MTKYCQKSQKNIQPQQLEDWFPLTQNKTLNPNIKYFTTQLTSDVSRLSLRGIAD